MVIISLHEKFFSHIFQPFGSIMAMNPASNVALLCLPLRSLMDQSSLFPFSAFFRDNLL